MNSAKEAPFLYRCATVSIDARASQAATALAEQDCAEAGLDMAEIGVVGVETMACAGSDVKRALQACAHVLGLPVDDAQLVYCEWASAHVDEDHAHSVFVNVVLATGPEPYCIQALASPARRGQQLRETRRIVRVGDAFVLDPCVAHLAAPANPCDRALLVLAQWSLPGATAQARAEVRRRFPALPNDSHQSSLLDF